METNQKSELEDLIASCATPEGVVRRSEVMEKALKKLAPGLTYEDFNTALMVNRTVSSLLQKSVDRRKLKRIKQGLYIIARHGIQK